MNPTEIDPHRVLGLKADADPEAVRSAYLRLIRENPPERDADKFQQIHSAYTMLNDPLRQAEAMLKPTSERPDLSAIIAAAENQPLRLAKLPLLALGNQE